MRMGHWTCGEPGSSLPQHQGFLHPGSIDDPVAHWPSLPCGDCSGNRFASQLHSFFYVESAGTESKADLGLSSCLAVDLLSGSVI